MDHDKGKMVAKEAAEFLENLEKFCSYTEDITLVELKAELRSEGVDPDTLLSTAMALIESKLKEANKQVWKVEARQRKKQLLTKMESVVVDIPKNIAEIKDQIRAVLSGNSGDTSRGRAQAFFRNLEEVNDDDLKSLYEEFMKLGAIDKQSKTNKES